MAKTKICPICGKEFTDSFFGNGENGVLNFGKFFSRADAHQISCCRTCADAYQNIAKTEGARFASKLNNLKKARRIRLNDEKIGKLFLQYIRQMEDHPVYDGEPGRLVHFSYVTPDGHFCVTEDDTTVVDFRFKDYMKSIDKFRTFDCSHMFTKDDISRLEYRRSSRDIRGLFGEIHTYEIRLNDEKEMSFKPCRVRYYTVGRGLFPAAKAKNEMRRAMEEFQRAMQLDLPICKVKKFK